VSAVGAVIDFFLPDEQSAGVIEERGRARIVVSVLLIIAAATFYVLVAPASPDPRLLNTFAIVWLSFSAGLLGAIRLGASPAICGVVLLAMYYLGSVGLIFASGGASIPAVVFACNTPLIAYAVRGRKAAIGWTLAVFGGLAVLSLYARSVDEFPLRPELLIWAEWPFLTQGMLVGMVAFAVLGFDSVIRNANEETEAALDQMRVQDARYRELVENMGDAMMEYDANLSCIYASPNWIEILGRRPEELLGMNYRNFIHREQTESLTRAENQIVAEPGKTVKFRSRIRHANGEWLNGETSARAFRNEAGKLHVVTIFRDLSELHAAQEAARHRDRLATAGTLSAGIAHQINNPIGMIRNASEFALLRSRNGDVGDIEEVLQNNIDQAVRCGEIIRSLLQFASRESSEKIQGDLGSVVESACSLTRSYAHESGIEIDVSLPSEPLPVWMNRIQLEQVLVNLFRNAVESAPKSCAIKVAVLRDGAHVRVECRDDGVGIAEKDLQQIFDPFYTTRLEDGGSGLGLSVALGIARDHQGALDIESQPGVGTSAVLTLSLALKKGDEAASS